VEARRCRLAAIPGDVPNPLSFPEGCKFHTRCPLTRELATGADAAQTSLVGADGCEERVLRRRASQEPSLQQAPGDGRHLHACLLRDSSPGGQ
jgi:ABC-type dipeptide/oligopeptide/nickel transport system ATPase component